MSVPFVSNASISGNTRTKVMDITMTQSVTLCSVNLSSQSGDPIWEIFLDKDVSDLPSPAQPTLAAATTGGNLLRSTTVFVRVSAVDSLGKETPASDTLKKIATGATTDTNKITVTIPAVAGAVAYRIYAGLNPASEVLLDEVVGTSFIITDLPPLDGIKPPCDQSFHIASLKNKLDCIPIAGSQLVVSNRIVVWVTADAAATVYVSMIGV